jgi:glycosyltransferase involved in cell wall biosynthesis
VLRRAAVVIALSASQARFLQRQYRISRENVVVIPNGVERSFYQERVPGEGARPADAPMRLLFVGRLDAQKNVIRLLDAMRHVSAPVELVIVGDGEQRVLAEEHLAATGLENVRMVGPQRGAALLERYAWADAFVLPSDKEGMPLVLLEAMASGLAVIATDVPGTRDLVDGVGLLAYPDAASLGAAIQRVASDKALCARLAAQADVRAGDHSWTQQISEVERVYDRVVSAR